MSYQVLARKWRPRSFREMVGQEHVLKALINALDHNRLHHAYLFTGTRGVGKTTIARILAKCLNCETGVSSAPCGQCSSCVEINEGRFVDLIEVDAASRTKVEDTRELLDNVQYAPTRGRYKIYLIDEVHMLSNHSFNALLKTLEEPPEHVKFLLATTDPQKLPVTILSRCLQFNLKNMSPERIVAHLQDVLTKEMVPFDDAGLWLLARAADGSMRDALSLTDQSIAFGGGKVAEMDVASMLGTIDHQLVQSIIGALVQNDGRAILNAVAKFSEHAPDYSAALADLLTLLHRIAIAQALPEALDNSYGDRKQILEFAQQLAPEDVQLFYQTALIGRRDLPLAADPRGGFEMTLLRMLAFKPQGVADVPTRPLQSNGANHDQSAAQNNSVNPTAESAQSIQESAQQEPAQVAAASTPADQSGSVNQLVSENPQAPAQDFGASANNMQSPVQPEQQSPQQEAAKVPPSYDAPAASPSETSSEQVLPDGGTGNEKKPLSEPASARSSADVGVPQADIPQAPPLDAYTEIQNDGQLNSGVTGNVYAAEPATSQPASPQAQAAVPQATVQQEAVSQPEQPTPSPAEDIKAQLKEQVKAIVGKEGITAEKKKALPSEAPAVAAAPQYEPVSLENFTPDKWVAVYRHLNIKGILQSTASNCVCVGLEENTLYFILDDSKASLFDQSHQQRLMDLISDYFGTPTRVEVNMGLVPEGMETPAMCFEREKRERHIQAVNDLNSDPVVQTLVNDFGGTLKEDSIVVKS